MSVTTYVKDRKIAQAMADDPEFAMNIMVAVAELVSVADLADQLNAADAAEVGRWCDKLALTIKKELAE